MTKIVHQNAFDSKQNVKPCPVCFERVRNCFHRSLSALFALESPRRTESNEKGGVLGTVEVLEREKGLTLQKPRQENDKVEVKGLTNQEFSV